MTLRSALWFPLFDELADPAVVVRLAAEAEEAGWDGLFVWDHVRWREPVRAAADPWIVLAAAAAVTERLRLGPMVTAIPRRRPTKLARETATLDRLSGGRLVLGAGLGSDRFGEEFSRTGEELDDRVRAAMLDESLAILRAAWSGETVRHRGEHYVVDDIRFEPVPHGVPVWIAGFPGKTAPMRRAARHDGYVPVNLDHPDQLAAAMDTIRGHRADAGASGPYDVAVSLLSDADFAAYTAAGMTWWLTDFDPHTITLDEVRGVLRDGPAAR
ncbi:LLM class flavin-dependent oxidoreductase [Jiangella anatolica]|uniref:LLM class flavin-dependent oxidoreductase n=1 Tax=Jiangella anatolica TaxID=2670374 RepID=A0A2W2C5Y8_9ACTN|nr:LLM class flavin-dependent oxidoreductase [Jiangella anatolica]PZF81166.1 LLM class flavin-dependent oxidoreductase [Jiangella anatolica]